MRAEGSFKCGCRTLVRGVRRRAALAPLSAFQAAAGCGRRWEEELTDEGSVTKLLGVNAKSRFCTSFQNFLLADHRKSEREKRLAVSGASG